MSAGHNKLDWVIRRNNNRRYYDKDCLSGTIDVVNPGAFNPDPIFQQTKGAYSRFKGDWSYAFFPTRNTIDKQYLPIKNFGDWTKAYNAAKNSNPPRLDLLNEIPRYTSFADHSA